MCKTTTLVKAIVRKIHLLPSYAEYNRLSKKTTKGGHIDQSIGAPNTSYMLSPALLIFFHIRNALTLLTPVFEQNIWVAKELASQPWSAALNITLKKRYIVDVMDHLGWGKRTTVYKQKKYYPFVDENWTRFREQLFGQVSLRNSDFPRSVWLARD